jgi:hypothetical protein
MTAEGTVGAPTCSLTAAGSGFDVDLIFPLMFQSCSETLSGLLKRFIDN